MTIANPKIREYLRQINSQSTDKDIYSVLEKVVAAPVITEAASEELLSKVSKVLLELKALKVKCATYAQLLDADADAFGRSCAQTITDYATAQIAMQRFDAAWFRRLAYSTNGKRIVASCLSDAAKAVKSKETELWDLIVVGDVAIVDEIEFDPQFLES